MSLTPLKSPRILAGLTGTAVILAMGLVPGSAMADDGNSMAALKRAAIAKAKDKGKAPSPAVLRAERRSQQAQPSGTTVGLVVGFKPSAGAAASARSLSAAGLKAPAANPLAALNARSVTVARADSARIAAELRADPAVAYVETDGVAQATDVIPNDPSYPLQTELPQITVPTAWEKTTGSAAVTVAVVDTGVTELGDLTGAVLPGKDFVNNDSAPLDDEGHGSAVASLIAGRGNNGVGIAGACWQCKILPVKVLNAAGSGSFSNIAAGVVYAADQGAKIINMSLGGYTPGTVLENAVKYALSKGAVIFASAGNDFLPNRLYPAAYTGVTAVGGTDEDGDPFVSCWIVCSGTNYGDDWVDVAAPYCTIALNLTGFANDTGGTDVDNDDYGLFCGTSAAAPMVSGVAALVKSQHPKANAWSLNNSLASTAFPSRYTDFVKYGEIRAGRAIDTVDETAPKITGAKPAQNTRFRGTVTVWASGVTDAGGAGLSHAALYIDGKWVGQDTTAPFSVKYNSGKRNGTVKAQWRVFDRAGNSAVYNRSLIADNAAPKVTITSGPKNNAKVKGTVTLKASASDASGIARVELLINGKVVAKDTAAAYSFKIKVSKYGKKFKVRLRAIDKVGNIAYTPVRTWKR